MGDRSREMEIPRKNQKEMLDIKNPVTETKNAFDGLINGLAQLRKGIWAKVHVNRNLQNWKTERTKTEKNTVEYPRTLGQKM